MGSLEMFCALIPFALAVASSTALAIYILMWRRSMPGAGAVALPLLAMAAWAVAHALELMGTTMSAKLFWYKMRYVGIVVLSPSWLVYILHYTRREKWLTRRTVALLCVVPVIVLLLVFTNESHGLMWSRAVWASDETASFLDITYSVGIWIPIEHAFILALVDTYLLVPTRVHSHRLYRRQIDMLLLATYLPWFAIALEFLRWKPYPQFQAVPFAVILVVQIGAWGVFRHRLGDIVPVAYEAIVKGMCDAVFVLDLQNRIVQLNSAAQRLIGQAVPCAIGQAIERVWSDWSALEGIQDTGDAILGREDEQRAYDVRISPLVDGRGRLVSRIVVLHDVSALREANEALRRARDGLEMRVEERTADLKRANRSLQAEIAKRQRAQEVLRESQERYRLHFENVTDVIFSVDREFRVLDVSPSVERHLGYKPEELIGKPFQDLNVLAPEYLETALSDTLRVLAGEPVDSTVYEFICKDGTRKLSEIGGAPLIREGEVIAVACVARDITERVRAEEDVRVRTAQLGALREVSLELSAQLDLDALLQSIVSRAVELLGGRTGGLYLYRPSRDVLEWVVSVGGTVPPLGSTLRRGEGMSGRGWETGEPLIVDDYQRWEGRLADYASLPSVAVLAVPAYWGGKLLGVVNVARESSCPFTSADAELLDMFAAQAAVAIENARLYEQAQQEIAVRQRAQEALRVSEEKYRLVVEHANDTIVVAQDGLFKFFNPRVTELTGYASEELIRQPFTKIIHPDDRSIVSARHISRLKGETPPPVYSFRVVDRDGNVKWVEIKAVLLTWEGRPATLSFLSDITERRQAEEQVKASLREKEVLLQEIHHRVKNNLQVVASLLNLQAGHVEDQRAIEVFHDSQNRVRSMALIHEKLYQSENLARVDFGDYVRELVAHLCRSYGARARGIRLKTDASDVFLGIDTAVPCGLILNELASNALKHAFPDGRMGEIRIGLSENDVRQVTLTVGDDGVGLPEGLDLYETDSLGLQLVVTLVNQLGGTIVLDSSEGTEFSVTFFAP